MSVLKFKNPAYVEGGSEEKWITLPTGGISDAPENGKQYIRKDGEWSEVDVPESSLVFTDLEASEWVEDTEYSSYPYRCDLTCEGVTADDYAEVVFGVAESTSGGYSPVCETKEGIVSIWSSSNAAITVLTVVITKQ